MNRSLFNTNVEKMRSITNSLEQKGNTEQLRYIRDGLYNVGGAKERLIDKIKRLIMRKKIDMIVNKYTLGDKNEYHYGVNIKKLFSLFEKYNPHANINEDTYNKKYHKLYPDDFNHQIKDRYYPYYVYISNYLKKNNITNIDIKLIKKIIKIYNNSKKEYLFKAVKAIFPLKEPLDKSKKLIENTDFRKKFNIFFYNTETPQYDSKPEHEFLENNEYYFYLEKIFEEKIF